MLVMCLLSVIARRLALAASLQIAAFAAQAAPEAVCPSETPAPNPTEVRSGIVPGDGPVDITADTVEVRDPISIFTGKVAIRYGTETLYADRVAYDKLKDEFEASGNVRVANDVGDAIETPHLQMQRATGIGHSGAVKFRFAQNGSRGDARRVFFHGRELVRLEGARYTRCPEGQDDWFISARRLELDYGKEVGSASHGVVRFKSVPLLYWPYITFPLSDQRKSGLLAPVFGNDNTNGFFFSVPYYWNLAPDYDLTITPRYLAKRGLQWQTEGRYLGETYDGVINYDYLYRDEIRNLNRYFASFKHNQYFGPLWSGDINLNNVSDRDYLQDFAFNIADAASTHMPQKLELRYADEKWRALGRVFTYQTLDKTLNPDLPYRRLPEILFTRDVVDGPAQAHYGLHGDIVNFQHSTRTTGQRFGLQPYAALPLRNSYSFFIPKVSARYTAYELNDREHTDSLVPIGSVDTGLIFERAGVWRERGYTQTLEPRLFYVNIPYRNQDAQPNFDTGPQDFNYSNLFRENRFFGGDRVGDANQVTAGVTTRVLDDDGGEWARVSLGQLYYSESPRILSADTPADAPSTRQWDRSFLVTQSRLRLGRSWYVRNDLQWNQAESETHKSSVYTQFYPRADRIINFGHRFVEATEGVPAQEQVEISTQWRVGQRWSLLAKNSYSLVSDSNLESFVGAEYQSCCWMGRLFLQQRVNPEQDQKYIYYFEFELSGLLKLGVSPITSPLSKGAFIFDD